MSQNQKIVPGTAGGNHVAGAPLTTAATRQAAPDLLVNAIDRRIVRISPSSTPIDQISRLCGSRHASSMEVQYYSVDTKAQSSEVRDEINLSKKLSNENGTASLEIPVSNASIFEVTETVLIPEGLDENGKPFVFYITEISENTLKALLINPFTTVDKLKTPAIPLGAKVIRMGRAAGELDVQTGQYQALPQKSNNFCQIFKAQIEQSTLQKLANKEVGWTLSDQEESAIMDMRAGMEKSFLFGQKRRLVDPVKGEEVFFTGGIWGQAGKEFMYKSFTSESLSELCAKAFTGSNGSRRKLLIGGTDLVKRLCSIEATKVATLGETSARWGIESREIVSNFGKLYLVHSEIFDQCGHSNDGMIIDPAYITKYSHIPFNAEKLNLRSSGTRNTDALVLTEASCLVLRYPEAHVRVIFDSTAV